MHITTVHTLSFTIKCTGNTQQTAARAIIEGGAINMGLNYVINSLPLPDGEDASNRNSQVQAMADTHEKCEHYWAEIQRALALVGVEATSP